MLPHRHHILHYQQKAYWAALDVYSPDLTYIYVKVIKMKALHNCKQTFVEAIIPVKPASVEPIEILILNRAELNKMIDAKECEVKGTYSARIDEKLHNYLMLYRK